MDTRSFINAITRMKTHILRRNTAETFVDGFDEHRGAAMALCRAELRVRKNVCEEWVIDLQQESCVNNRCIFGPKCGPDRVKEFRLGAIVLVRADTAGRDRRHEYGVMLNA